MYKLEAELVQDASGLVAAALRGDDAGRAILLGPYLTGERFPLLVEAFVYYTSTAVQMQARLVDRSWWEVLQELPVRSFHLLEGVTPDWAFGRRLIEAVTASSASPIEDFDVVSIVETTHGLAVSATLDLAQEDLAGALAWASEISLLAGLER